MWVRVTCPNGHKLKIESKYLGRKNQCPVCAAVVSMWIQVKCLNGHSLRVQSKYAGKRGVCPECKQPVNVPDLTEIIAMATLQQEAAEAAEAGAAPAPTPVHQEDDHQDSPSIIAASSTTNQMPLRVCKGCKSKIPISYRTCPICNCYIGDFHQEQQAVHAQSTHCPECDATSFPGDEFCRNCGAPLPTLGPK